MHDGRVYESREVRRHRLRAIRRMVAQWLCIVIVALGAIAACYLALWASFHGGA